MRESKVRCKMREVLTPIIAYRGWRVSGKNLFPLGVFFPNDRPGTKNEVFVPQKLMVAKCFHIESHSPFWSLFSPLCRKSDEKPPTDNCSCGIYAVKNLNNVVVEYRDTWSDFPIIFGKVALWGKIIEHEKGYRAEFAYPQVFYEHQYSQNLANAWGIETAPIPELSPA